MGGTHSVIKRDAPAGRRGGGGAGCWQAGLIWAADVSWGDGRHGRHPKSDVCGHDQAQGVVAAQVFGRIDAAGDSGGNLALRINTPDLLFRHGH